LVLVNRAEGAIFLEVFFARRRRHFFEAKILAKLKTFKKNTGSEVPAVGGNSCFGGHVSFR